MRRWAEPVAEAEARVLARAFLAAGVVALLCVVFPFSPTAPTRLDAVLACVAATFSVSLWLARRRLPVWVVHAVIIFAVTVVSGCVAASTTPSGAAVTAFGFVWLAIYVAWFHPGRAVAVHAGLIGIGLLAGLVGSGAPSAAQTWFFVMVSVGGVAGALDVLVRRLRRAAERDQLTGLPNRATFLAAAQRAITVPRRGGVVTVAVIDLDDFKLVNDRDGHAAGDRLLAGLAHSWQSSIRASDLLARYGGDEFVLLMPGTTTDEAAELLQRLAAVDRSSRWTAGIAQWAGESLEEWIARADADLYRGKARARSGGSATHAHAAPATGVSSRGAEARSA